MQKKRKKSKKPIDNKGVVWYINQALEREVNAGLGTVKSFEKAEKLLDKRVPVWYNKIPL